MNKRNPARPGLSYVDANKGRLVTYAQDVLGYKNLIEETWPELECAFDDVDEQWVVFEHCKDGVDRLYFTTESLNEQTLERIRKGDQYRCDPSYDAYEAMEKAQDAWEEELDNQLDEKLGEAHERFLHALRKDGFTSGPIFMGDSIENKARRVDRIADYS